MLKGKGKSLDEDEETTCPRGHRVEEEWFWPRRLEVSLESHPTESGSGKEQQVGSGLFICSQIKMQKYRLAAIKETFDINFWSTGGDNPEPRSMCSGVCQDLQDLQDVWVSLGATTLIKCVNDKDESPFWDARKFANEVEEESMLH